MIKIPQGWVNCQLLEISEVVTGKTPSKKHDEYFNGVIPFIKPGDVRNQGVIESTEETLTEFGANTVTCIPPDSIPVTCIGNLGRTAITKVLSATNQQINSVVPCENVSTKFLYYYLRTIKNWMEAEASSTTVTIINKGRFLKAPVILPPLNEQIRIADKLDRVLAKVDEAQAQLEKIPTLLKRFRQSVLAAATSGELTREWRGDAEFGKTVSIGDLTSDIRYGTSKKCSYDGGDTAVLRIPNIGDGKIDAKDLKFANFDKDENEKLSLKKGDILIIRSNGSVDLVGKAALVSNKDTGYLFAGYLIRIRFTDEFKVEPKYVLFCLQSPSVRHVVELNARSTSGINNINSKELAALELDLPVLAEQKEIVRRVESLFAQADAVEKQYLAAKQRLDRLSQSLLAKAFRGELVPQDPNDEPATELLKRIQDERQSQSPTKHKRSKPA